MQNYSSGQWWSHCKATFSLNDPYLYPYTCILLGSLYSFLPDEINCSFAVASSLSTWMVLNYPLHFCASGFSINQNIKHTKIWFQDCHHVSDEKRKRGVYNTKTIQGKATACRDLEGGMALWCVAKKYVISKSTVVSWHKQNDNILTDANRVRKDKYRCRKSPATEVELSFLMWIKQMNSLPNPPPFELESHPSKSKWVQFNNLNVTGQRSWMLHGDFEWWDWMGLHSTLPFKIPIQNYTTFLVSVNYVHVHTFRVLFKECHNVTLFCAHLTSRFDNRFLYFVY